MASTLTKQTASPYCLKYTLSADSGSQTATKTAAQLIADCAVGPLKTFLTQANGGLNAGQSGLGWANLDFNTQLSVYVKQTGTSGSVIDLIGPSFNTGANRFDVSTLGDGATSAVIEIRYHRSEER